MASRPMRASLAKQMMMTSTGRATATDMTAAAAAMATGYGVPGALSPLMRSYMQGAAMGGNANAFVPLMRNPAVYTDGAFNPSAPMIPIPIDPSQPGSRRPMPRIQQYPVGYNLPSQPGQTKLVPFQLLRNLADMYDIARRCIEVRKQEVASVDWDIVPREDYEQGKGKFPSGSRAKKAGLFNATGQERRHIKDFFMMPDRIRGLPMSDWMKMMVEEIMVTDTPTVYEHPTIGGKGGPLGSDLFALEILDGTLIKPLVDDRGTRPLPPNPAFQQFVWGIPRADLVALLFDAYDDPEVQALQRGFPGANDEAEFMNLRADQLYYRPYVPRPWTMYGFSNIEQIIININVALKRQQFHLAYFTDGDIPAMLIHAPDNWNLDQIQKYEQQWHTMLSGDEGWKHRVRMIPGVEKVEQLKPPIHDMTFDEFVLKVTCAGMDVDPSEIGFQFGSNGLNAGSQQSSSDRTYRLSLRPLLSWFQEYFDDVTSRRLHKPEYVFRFNGLEIEDRKLEAEIDEGAVKLGGLALNEWRARRGLDPIDDPKADQPNVYLTRDVVPVNMIGELTFSSDQMGIAQGIVQQPPGGGAGRAGAPSAGGSASPTPRAGGASASGGSATNQKRSPAQKPTSTNKLAEAAAELKVFEKFINKPRARKFIPEVLPQGLVDYVYEQVSEGRATKVVFDEVRRGQAMNADEILGDIVEKLLDLPADPSKANKGAAGYTTGTPSQNCGNCVNMNSDGTCDKVVGIVDPEMVCNLWSDGDADDEDDRRGDD